MRTTLDGRHYQTYINSPAWRARRRRFLETAGPVCCGCGRTTDLHVHHRSYANLGRELDADLVVLCRTCHSGVHVLAFLFHDLERATDAVIDSRPAAPDTRSRPEFVPLNQRIGMRPKHLGGKAGRLSGLPIRHIPSRMPFPR